MPLATNASVPTPRWLTACFSALVDRSDPHLRLPAGDPSAATHKQEGSAPSPACRIGLSLTLIHLISIPCHQHLGEPCPQAAGVGALGSGPGRGPVVAVLAAQIVGALLAGWGLQRRMFDPKQPELTNQGLTPHRALPSGERVEGGQQLLHLLAGVVRWVQGPQTVGVIQAAQPKTPCWPVVPPEIPACGPRPSPSSSTTDQNQLRRLLSRVFSPGMGLKTSQSWLLRSRIKAKTSRRPRPHRSSSSEAAQPGHQRSAGRWLPRSGDHRGATE